MSLIPVGFGASASGYTIDNSLRFDGSNDYLSRTFGTATNQKKWTWSGWVKRSALGGQRILCAPAVPTGAPYTVLEFESTDELRFLNYNGSSNDFFLKTNAKYRDPSGHFHVVVVYDSDNATQAHRMRLYVNGDEPTLATSTRPAGTGLVSDWNKNSNAHYIGTMLYFGSPNGSFSGYLSDIYFIDGQALAPTDFGETNADGVWVPKAYAGTYGTNGFHLDFSDGTSTTTLGYDAAGSNDWTLNGMTRAAGVSECWMTDTPTNNFATLNPLMLGGAGVDTSNGLLYANRNSAGWARIVGTIGVSSGKWYFEWLPNNNITSNLIGVGQATTSANYAGYETTSWGYNTANGDKRTADVGSAYGSAYSGANPIGVAFDMDNGKIWFSRDGTFEASGDPAAGTNAAFTNLSGTVFPQIGLNNANTNGNINFGQRPFIYTPPSGFKALCTANLPSVTIANPADHFDIKTRTGTGASADITGFQFQPDLVWTKSRGRAVDHALFDAVRGVQKMLESNQTGAESTEATGLTAFNSDGYTIGALDQINGTTATNSFVDWAWKANGAGSSNTAGSITSTVSANTTAGFSIVTYTGTGANATVGHGLGVAPKMVIVKARGSATYSHWQVYHANSNATPQNYVLQLSSTVAATSDSTVWNNTAPTSSVFSIGTSLSQNTITWVAYCFVEVPGFSKFGSYTGNGSTDGPFVFCGFRPRWVMMKSASSAGTNWRVFDAAREPENVIDYKLSPNNADAEYTDANTKIDFTASGFKLRETAGDMNTNTATYIYAAFAEFPNGSNVAPAPAR